jgi:hypothetical protein
MRSFRVKYILVHERTSPVDQDSSWLLQYSAGSGRKAQLFLFINSAASWTPVAVPALSAAQALLLTNQFFS